MKLTVMLPVDKETAIEVIKLQDKEQSASLLSLVLGNWMLCAKPVFTKQEILQLVHLAGEEVFVTAILDRLCNCGNYNDYDKFFDLAASLQADLRAKILLKVVHEMNVVRQERFVAKCQREYEQVHEMAR